MVYPTETMTISPLPTEEELRTDEEIASKFLYDIRTEMNNRGYTWVNSICLKYITEKIATGYKVTLIKQILNETENKWEDSTTDGVIVEVS